MITILIVIISNIPAPMFTPTVYARTSDFFLLWCITKFSHYVADLTSYKKTKILHTPLSDSINIFR